MLWTLFDSLAFFLLNIFQLFLQNLGECGTIILLKKMERNKMNFFAPADSSTALGMYSSGYFITLFIVLCIITIALIRLKNLEHKKVEQIIFGIGLFCLITEIIKMVFTGITYGIENVEWIPLYFCSCFIFTTFMALSKNALIRRTGECFLFYGGLIGSCAFFCYPSACIPVYPLFHFMTIRTFIYHGSMLFISLLVIETGYFVPEVKKDFIKYSIFLGIVSILAYTSNCLFHKNFMYMSEPLAISISMGLYNLVPHLYPFIFMILQLVVPFFISYGIYIVLSKSILKNHLQSVQA